MGKKVAKASQGSPSSPSENSLRTSRVVQSVENNLRSAIKEIAIGRIASRWSIEKLCTTCSSALEHEVALLERKGDPFGVKNSLIELQGAFDEEMNAEGRSIADSKKTLTAMGKSVEAIYHRTIR